MVNTNTEIIIHDTSNYLDCKTKEDFGIKVSKYYNLPPQALDTPEHGEGWKKECPEVEEYGYDPYFEYKNNSAGFRDSEIDENVDICYYGCSITYGVGVPTEARWTSLIDKEFNFKSNNFAISGISTEEMLKLFMVTSRFVKMKRAAFNFPDIYRYTMPIFHEGTTFDGYTRMHPMHETIGEESDFLKKCGYSKICRHFYSLPDSFFIDRFRIAIQTIIYIAEINNIELYFSTWTNATTLLKDISTKHKHINVANRMILDRRGRDLMVPPWAHTGILSHKALADDYINLIKLER